MADGDAQRFTSDGLDELLCELADAARDCADHTTRHPAVNPMETGYWQAADPKAAKEDWGRAWRRKERAMEAVIAYAVGRYGTEVK